MGVASNAAQEAIRIANDNTHGYDQTNRLGNPDYDCSSLVIDVYKKQGVPLTCTFTGNMLGDMLAKGFKNVNALVNRVSGAGMEPGDVLLNVANHAAIYVGNNLIVQASKNEKGTITGGQPGDQTGNEIAVRGYYNFPWDYVLRYTESGSTSIPVTPGANTSTQAQKPVEEIQNGIYTVKQGDSLWDLAAKFYGKGTEFTRIMKDNGLTSSSIKPGMQLKIGQQTQTTTPVQTPTQTTPVSSGNCTVTLPILKYGDTGMRVRKVQALLKYIGYSTIEIDGDFGPDTKSKIELFQKAKGFSVTGTVDAKTYEALLS